MISMLHVISAMHSEMKTGRGGGGGDGAAAGIGCFYLYCSPVG